MDIANKQRESHKKAIKRPIALRTRKRYFIGNLLRKEGLENLIPTEPVVIKGDRGKQRASDLRICVNRWWDVGSLAMDKTC